MKLRKLILSGFKSFADRTQFEFDDGVSCIVGPNGCGKSNIVDAFKWVLGEQSAKSLRGSEMMDVIFNGSSSRRACGSAEVTLVFDNSDGTLQGQGDKADGEGKQDGLVSITRRLYRSGQSEYLINKTPSRLKDIREMFMDTGLGRDAYGLIEQGKVEAFLQASQDDRRAIFDEAAGISKYKARKKEALRKLERVEQNLLRVTDVLAEVEKRLRSIKYQAGKARNYQAYSERLKELRSLHLLAQYHQLTQNRHAVTNQLEAATDRQSAVNARIGQLESSRSAAEVESVDLERSARDLQGRSAAVGGQITTCEQRSEMLEARAGELQDQLVQNSHTCEELEARIETAQEQLADKRRQLEAKEREAQGLAAKLEELRDEHTRGEHALAGRSAEMDEAKNAAIDLMRRIAQCNNEMTGLGVREENLAAQARRLDQRSGQIDQELQQIRQQRRDQGEQLDKTQAQIDRCEEEIASASARADQLADGEQELRCQLSQAREKRSGLLSRIHALEEMQQRLEGVGKGVKKILAACKEGKLPAVRGLLGEKIDSDVAHASMVEAALSGADQLLVIDSFEALQSSRARIEQAAGSSTALEFLCLDRAGASSLIDPGPESAVTGCLRDVVRCDASIRPAVMALLGNTFMVEDLESATRAASCLPGGARFVTPAGEVLEADGRVRLGSGKAAGLISRRSELAELSGQEQALEEEIRRLGNECDTTRQAREDLEATQKQLRKELYDANARRIECKSQLSRLEEQQSHLEREKPTVRADIEGIESEIQAAGAKRDELAGKVCRLEEQSARCQERIEALQARMADDRRAQDQLASSITEQKVELASREQQKLSLRDALAALNRQIQECEASLHDARNSIDLCRQRREDALKGAAEAREEIESLYEQQKQLNAEAEDIEESRKSVSEKLNEIRAALSQQRKASEASSEQVNSLRVKLNEADVRIENLITRASDEGMDLTEAYEGYEHDDQRNWQAVADEIDDLRGKIDRLGNVNLDAISEQEELEQRGEFLANQIEDIRNSQRELDELVKRINRESRELFLDTFNAVRENFQQLFRKLFGGGKADIMLLDPEDVLESGIEIVARPPGKELRNLSLLSGGEKTMTALSLLFSIFKSRPSPFCLLDEVDAALDEANTERFSRLVQEFVGLSQFIVISHAKRTMAMSNVLYGVTMQEAGVSSRISVRFEDVGETLDEKLEPVEA
jgi:chromosome segregation protein